MVEWADAAPSSAMIVGRSGSSALSKLLSV
jgi:hypothetical protein